MNSLLSASVGRASLLQPQQLQKNQNGKEVLWNQLRSNDLLHFSKIRPLVAVMINSQHTSCGPRRFGHTHSIPREATPLPLPSPSNRLQQAQCYRCSAVLPGPVCADGLRHGGVKMPPANRRAAGITKAATCAPHTAIASLLAAPAERSVFCKADNEPAGS